MAFDAVLWQESQSASDVRFLDGIRRLKASCLIDVVVRIFFRLVSDARV